MAEWKGDDIDPEDVVIEPENGSEEIEGNGEQKLAKLREDLATTRKEKQEYMDGWQRAKADYVNLLKRFEVETKSSKTAGIVKAVETLLPAFDALERAKDLPAGRQGMEEGFIAIARQLESAFASLGLTPIGEIGEQFDPALHEALGQDSTESAKEDDRVTAVLEKGWRIDDIIIRPAKVRVAHFT
jgi:molecular chaperone GrpE